MATKYSYTISSEFPNGVVNIDRLTIEVRDSGISTALEYIAIDGGECEIWFKSDLSTKDETTLDGLVAVHSGEEPEVVDTMYDRTTGKIRVHQTSRQPGTKTFFTGASDDTDNIMDVGGGPLWMTYHKVGDPIDDAIYFDFNSITNDTWIHEGYITWKNCMFDSVTVSIVPRTVSYELSGLRTPVFNGSGLNNIDTTAVATLDMVQPTTYRISIDGDGTPDTFRWSKDGGDTWEDTDVAMTGGLQELDHGVGIIFGTTTGHTIGDYWEIRAVPENTTYNLYGGYLIIPAAYDGNVFVTSDITQCHGGLVQTTPSEDGTMGTSFWNADWNPDTGLFENIAPAPFGDGGYNLFAVEVTLAIFINRLPLLGDGFVLLQTSDVEQWSHGWRAKFSQHTYINSEDGYTDHAWESAMYITLHRARLA